jgi:hypothetical protein
MSILFSVNDFIEPYQNDSNAVATSMCIALLRVRTKILSQLFGVNESAAPRDMQSYFDYQQN